MLKVTTLPSGLRVATYKVDRQMSGIVIIIGAGKRYEQAQEAGLSHFLEHMLMAGTKTYPTAISLRDAIESLGGSRNATTSREYVTFEINILREHLDFALKTLAEQLKASVLDPDEIERQKGIIGDELLRNRTHPESYVGRAINELLWPNHPLGGSMDLEEKNLRSVNKNLLTDYLNKYYTAPNTLVCLAGNIKHEEYVKKVEEIFNSLPHDKTSNFLPAQEIKVKAVKLEPKVLKQTHLALAFYGPSRKGEERLPARVLASILNRNITTKLRYELGITYHADASYTSFEDTGRFLIEVSLRPDRTKQALTEIFSEITRIKEKGVSEDSLKRAQSRTKTLSIKTSESVTALADDYAFRTFFNYSPLLINEEVELIERVTQEDIKKVAQKYLNDTFKMLVAGPKKEIGELEKLYGK